MSVVLVCVAGRKTIVGGIHFSCLDRLICVWVGLGVLVLFENSIVCQCIFCCLWVGCALCCVLLFVVVCGVCRLQHREPLMAVLCAGCVIDS